jgi:hypothetical protein
MKHADWVVALANYFFEAAGARKLPMARPPHIAAQRSRGSAKFAGPM